MFLNERIDCYKIDRAFRKLSIITNPMRAEIIMLLLEHKNLSVTEIQQKLTILQAEASHHLNLLNDFGVLKRIKEGKKTLYYVDEECFNSLMAGVKLLAEGKK